MQDDLIEAPAPEGEGVRAEGDEAQGQLFVDGGQIEHRVRLVTHDDFAAEQPAHDPHEVLELGGGDPRHAIGVLDHRDAAAEAQHEAAAGEALHGPRYGGGDHGVPGVVVGGRRDDGHLFAHRSGGAGQHGRFLLVEPLRNEGGAESEPFGQADLAYEIP